MDLCRVGFAYHITFGETLIKLLPNLCKDTKLKKKYIYIYFLIRAFRAREKLSLKPLLKLYPPSLPNKFLDAGRGKWGGAQPRASLWLSTTNA